MKNFIELTEFTNGAPRKVLVNKNSISVIIPFTSSHFKCNSIVRIGEKEYSFLESYEEIVEMLKN